MTALAMLPPHMRMPGGFELPRAYENPTVLVGRLGSRTQVLPNGLIEFDEPLMTQIVHFHERAIPALAAMFKHPPSDLALLEGIRVAEKLADTNTPGVETLYAPLSQWNTHPNPMIQIYLAGLYRRLNLPATVGPMLATLMHQSMTNYQAQGSPMQNITEEVGGTILQQFADTTAKSVMTQLAPWLLQMEQQLQELQFSL